MGSYISKPPRTEAKLTGRIAIVTGGNRGIGLSTVKQLYALGATVYVGARSEDKARKAIELIRNEVPRSDGQLKSLIADMSSIRKAKEAAERFLAMENYLDILILNAAIAGDYETNEDGIETAMATNHFGPFVFTKMLLDLMKKTSSKPGSDVRIVAVSSVVHEQVDGLPIQFKDEAEVSVPFPANNSNTWSQMMARYGRSKLANVLFVNELQSRLEAERSGIIALSLHPGAVATDGAMGVVSGIPIVGRFANLIIGLFFAHPDEGALTSMFAATNPIVRAEPDKYKGKYLTAVDKVTPSSELSQDQELARRLWELSERIVESKATVLM